MYPNLYGSVFGGVSPQPMPQLQSMSQPAGPTTVTSGGGGGQSPYGSLSTMVGLGRLGLRYGPNLYNSMMGTQGLPGSAGASSAQSPGAAEMVQMGYNPFMEGGGASGEAGLGIGQGGGGFQGSMSVYDGGDFGIGQAGGGAEAGGDSGFLGSLGVGAETGAEMGAGAGTGVAAGVGAGVGAGATTAGAGTALAEFAPYLAMLAMA